MNNPFSSEGAGWGSLLGGLFGQGQGSNPADAANPYMNQIAPLLQQYMSPYTQMGQRLMPQLEQQYQNLMQNPGQMQKQMGAGFQQDPGYQWNVDQATKAANQSAAAGGMLGSPQNQQQSATMVSGLANQNYQNYLNNNMGMYGMGLQGMNGMFNTGFNAAQSLSGDLARALESQANLAYAGQNNKNQQQGGMFGGIGEVIGGLSGLFDL
jgi:hypothetical protein